MATILHKYGAGDSTYNCPQRAELNRQSFQSTVRRLSQDSERRQSETEIRRRSSVISEKASAIGSFQSLQAGKLPTNEQLNSAITRLINSKVIENNKKFMSPDGQLLLNDFQGLMVSLQHALYTKNRDGLFQSMIYHVRKSEIPANDLSPNDTEQVKDEVKIAGKAILKISKLLLFNSKFRALLTEILAVAQQTLGSVMQKSGKIISDNANNNASAVANSLTMDKTQKTETDPVILAPEMSGSTENNNAHEQIHQQLQEQEQIHQQLLDQLQQQKLEQQDALSTKEIITRLKDVFTTMQKNREYQRAISTIFSLLSIWSKRLSNTSAAVTDSSAGSDNFVTTAALEAKAIIEDWAQGRSLDPIIEKSDDLASKIKEDSELSQLFDKIKNYIQGLLQEPGYLEADSSTNDGTELVNQLRHSAIEKYRPEIDSLMDESNGIVSGITDDPTTKEISSKIKAIHNHLWYDRNGHVAFKPQLLNDVRITVIPAIIEQIKYVPLPQIIYSDKQYEIAIENMVLSGDTLMPDIFEVKIDDYLRFSPHRNLDYVNSQSMHLTLSGIQTTIEDVVFYYKKKTGFPRLSDAGVVSIATGGAGVKINMTLISKSIDQDHAFRVDRCHCHIDQLHINVLNSHHNLLYKVFNPMVTGIIKRQITKAVENKIINMVEKSDRKVTKHLFQRRDSLVEMQQQTGAPVTADTRRPGLLSHTVNILSKKVAAI